MPELYGLLLYLFLKLPGMTAYPTVFPISIKIEKKVTFNSCLNLFFFFNFFSYGYILLFHNCPQAGNTRRLYEIFLCYLIRLPLL